MQDNHPTPFNDRIPFTRAEARAAGISPKQLMGNRYQRLFYDLYVSAAVAVTPAVRATAVLRVCPPRSQVSHFTAAELWGGIVPSQPLTHVSCPHLGVRSERRGVGIYRLSPHAQVVRLRGIRVSSPEQTFIDLACALSLVDLVVLGDSLVKAKRTTVDRLVRAVKAWSGWGSRPARRAVGFVRDGVDSPMESRLRMLIVLAGLPEPQVNRIVPDGSGNWNKRFDLCYPDLLLVIEYDGRQHAENDEQWDRDLDRREDLDGNGWRLIVIRSKGIYVEPHRTLERIADAMRTRGARNVPASFRDEVAQSLPRPIALITCRVWSEDVPVWRVAGYVCRVWSEDVPVWRVAGYVCRVWVESRTADEDEQVSRGTAYVSAVEGLGDQLGLLHRVLLARAGGR